MMNKLTLVFSDGVAVDNCNQVQHGFDDPGYHPSFEPEKVERTWIEQKVHEMNYGFLVMLDNNDIKILGLGL